MTAEPFETPDIPRTRAEMAAEARDEPREPVDRVEDLDAAGVRVRAYVPRGAPGTLVFAHGGGFCFGDLDTHDGHCRRMVNRTGWAVLAVDYRRPPEVPYPAAVRDVDAVTDWLVASGTASPVPRNRLVAIGDSAGANLALVGALHHPGVFEALVLIYPFVDPACRFMRQDDEEDAVSAQYSRWYWKTYAGPDLDPTDPDLAPIESPDLGALPRTWIATAELDHLRPENEELARRMVAAGADVTLTMSAGVDHGFWRRAFQFPQAQESLRELAAFLS